VDNFFSSLDFYKEVKEKNLTALFGLDLRAFGT